jgi:SAM-dependent methyltransferase
VLDIGCGEGAMAAELLNGFSGPYRGFELSSSAIDAARGRGINGARFDLFDGDVLPCADRSFDLAVLSHVVEHLEHPRVLLKEAKRVAKWVLVEVPLEYGWKTPKDFRPNDVGHINSYDVTLIRHLMQTTGLVIKADRVTNVSRGVLQYDRPRVKATIRWAIRELALDTVPVLAGKMFTYHGAFLGWSGDHSISIDSGPEPRG